MSARKRINIVSIKMVKESSLLYEHREINEPRKAVDLVRFFTDGADREKFIVVALDTKNKPTAVEVCSVGDLNSTIVNPREVFKMSVVSNAARLMVAHVHPSGDCRPSNADDEVTDRLKSAGEIMGITLLDHIIVGDESYFSYKEAGRL